MLLQVLDGGIYPKSGHTDRRHCESGDQPLQCPASSGERAQELSVMVVMLVQWV